MRSLSIIITIFLVAGACEKSPPPETTAPSTTVAGSESPATAPSTEPTSRGGWLALEQSRLNDVQEAQLTKATAAQQALGKRLLGDLTTSVAERGFAKSVTFCRGAAPRIADEVAAEYGVELGRTSHKLRNPANTPPAWAADAVAHRAEQRREQGSGQKQFFAGPEGAFGVLAPIEMAEMCTNCHGTPDQLADGVSDVLAEQYPDDEAIGFDTGELRGWFWIEVPGPA